MWVRYLKALPGVQKGSVAWSDDDTSAQQGIDDGILVRCTGPDGIAIGEDTPENVITALAKEDNVSFAEKEQELQSDKAQI